MRYFAPQECDELKKRYEEEGYVVVDGIYDDTELSAMDRYFEDFKHSGAKLYKGGKTHQEIDPTRDILRAMHPHRISEQARDWAVHPRVAQVLEHVMGRAPLLAQTMMYYKPLSPWGSPCIRTIFIYSPSRQPVRPPGHRWMTVMRKTAVCRWYREVTVRK